MELAACSLNTITVRSLSLRAVVDQATRRGIPAIAPWRDIVQGAGVDVASHLIHDAGLSVTSLVRGGLFTALEAAGRRAAIEDTRRALDEAASIGAPCLVLVCGGLVGRDLAGSRAMVRDGIEAVLPHAAAAGIHLGVEPLHPMMVAGRSVVTTLGEANDLVGAIDDPWLGVIVDAYHVWWDAALWREIDRARGRILGCHVSDWVTPITGELSSRGMMGDGCIDLPALVSAVRAAGYAGPVEIEILSDRWWSEPPDRVLDLALERFATHV